MYKVSMFHYNEDSWSQGDYKKLDTILTEDLDLAEEFIQKFFDKFNSFYKIYNSGYGSLYGEI